MVFFKAEANEQVGGGHLHRCLAIARELRKQNIKAEFINSETNNEALNKIRQEGFIYHEIEPKKSLTAEKYFSICPPRSLIVFDTDNSAFYSGKFIEKLRKNNRKTAVFTVTDKHHIATDLLINPNIISKTHNYKTATHTKKITGSHFMIFSENIRNANIQPVKPKPEGNLFVFFGNSDPNGLTKKFLNALPKIQPSFKNIFLLIGILNKDYEAIINSTPKYHPNKLQILRDIKNMSKIYQQTDIAIVSGGMTMWEAALWKIPLMVIPSGERELPYVNYLASKNYICKIGESQTITANEMAEKINTHIKKELILHTDRQSFADTIDAQGIQNIVKELINQIQNA